VDNTKTIRTISFFTGYGGVERGLEERIHHLASCEIEAYAQANLIAKMEEGALPPHPIWTDAKTFPSSEFCGVVDLFTGGFPCQPFSAAGSRNADEDPRHLFPACLQFIEGARPHRVFLDIESSLKTSKDSLVQNLEETIGQTPKGRLYSSMCLESWKDEVTKQRGEYSQRLKQAHLIRERESSSLGNWPTPNTMDSIAPKSQEALDRNRKKGGCANLREWIHHEGTYQYPNWPSPIVRDHMDNYGIHLKNRKDGKKRDDTLPRKVYGQHDLDNGNSPLNSLELNPNWVEQLMGLPPGLTDLGSWGMESSHKPQPSPGELLTRDFEWEENLLKMASS